MMDHDLPPEAGYVRDIVARHFSVNETKSSEDALFFYCHTFPDLLEERFKLLRKDLWKDRYVPFVETEGGEYIIKVVRIPPQQYRSAKFNIVFLIATILTTTLAGAIWWSSYTSSEEMFSMYTITRGVLFFTIPLMTILGVHETGHYLAAKKHGVAASLPFFIPVPPFGFPLGTLGAFINMREPIPDKKALMEIGAAGPISGFIVALPVAIIGLILTGMDARQLPQNIGDAGGLSVHLPLTYELLALAIPIPDGVRLHPMAFAGWVGLFVTALNLLPMGQLDGGHIFRAFFGKNSHYVSYMVVAGMVFLSFLYTGWIILVFLVLFFGLKHPPPLNDISPLGKKQRVVGVVAILLFITCFVPIPLSFISPSHALETEMDGMAVNRIELNATAEELITLDMEVQNVGNTFLTVIFDSTTSFRLVKEGWDMSVGYRDNVSFLHMEETPRIGLNSSENASFNITIIPPENVLPGEYSLGINMQGVKSGNRVVTSNALEIQYTINP